MYVFLIIIAVLGLIATAIMWRRVGLKAAIVVAGFFVFWGVVVDGVYTVVTWVGHDRVARREAASERRAANAERRERRQSEPGASGGGPATPISPNTDQP